MKSMKIEAKEKREAAQYSIVGDEPRYPYGLKLHFDNETFEKLGLADVPKVGQKFMVLAVAEVCDVHQDNYEGDEKKYSMGLQITDMDIKTKGEQKDVASQLYDSKES